MRPVAALESVQFMKRLVGAETNCYKGKIQINFLYTACILVIISKRTSRLTLHLFQTEALICFCCFAILSRSTVNKLLMVERI